MTEQRQGIFKNWRIAASVTGIIAFAAATAVFVAASKGCDLSIGASGVELQCEPDSPGEQ